MKPIFTRGQLVTWKEDKGFGFIKANNGGKDVFLHISALPDSSRRPRVGDTILYQRMITPKGKPRATKASIAGVKPKSPTSKRHSHQKTRRTSKIMAGWLSLAGLTLVVTVGQMTRRNPDPITAMTKPGCLIKGNISIDTDKKLYHLPGMEDYDITVVSPEHGEKWFCTEDDAIANGWQKAPK